ncbi:MAG TPA: 30S ribosomal protein S6 [Patescibacteria group bacterium]|nr:30S ribosomal protein S6 [Patescibacteria group bacterium]
MKGYELLYIVGTQFTDQEIADIQGKINASIEEAGAKVLKSENLGKIKLAYPIKKIRHGSYILTYFDAETSAVSDLNRRLSLREEILRHTLLERPAGALERTFELVSYIAPLSEEARPEKEMKRPPAKTFKKVEEQVAAPLPVSATESSMTMEELDQKLDKILEGDIAENI